MSLSAVGSAAAEMIVVIMEVMIGGDHVMASGKVSKYNKDDNIHKSEAPK